MNQSTGTPSSRRRFANGRGLEGEIVDTTVGATLTPQQMRELAKALEGVDDALPANTGVRIIAARATLRTAADRLEAVQDHERISSAVGEVLCNVSNYPPAVSFRLLGQDIGPLREKVTANVLAILTADTGPQEPHHERPAGYCETHGVRHQEGRDD